jgi:uncharacterized membrane protein YedE/YeeE
MDLLMMDRWSPYLCGAGIGILSWLTFLLSDTPIGTSTSFARTAGMLETLIRGERVLQRPFFRKAPPRIDWQWMLVVGIVLGSFLSAVLSGNLKIVWVPEPWNSVFGSAVVPRLLVAFAGGILLGLGSRWGSGCTSGHGISGTLQLALSSWVAALCFFTGGIAVATFLYAGIGG